jgi:protease PrsW
VAVIIIAFAPVAAFLIALLLMDRFKLVRLPAVFMALAAGAGAAVISLGLNELLLRTYQVPPGIVSRYIAPVAEETAKALFVAALIVSGRIAFLVEAAIQGFAAGTGFALLENLSYLRSIPDASLALWIVRGLGTAVLQGATTMLFAMMSKTLFDRRDGGGLASFAPGWIAAIVIHSVFNHRWLPPVAQTLLMLIVLPLLVLWVFDRSERATGEWIGAGLDLDIGLLDLIKSDQFGATAFARYLRQLRDRTPGPIVADMFCLLRLEVELAVQAKALLMAREAGLELPVDDDLEAALAERRYLRHSIGPIGLLALKPLGVGHQRDRWHRHVLQQGRARRRVPS